MNQKVYRDDNLTETTVTLMEWGIGYRVKHVVVSADPNKSVMLAGSDIYYENAEDAQQSYDLICHINNKEQR